VTLRLQPSSHMQLFEMRQTKPQPSVRIMELGKRKETREFDPSFLTAQAGRCNALLRYHACGRQRLGKTYCFNEPSRWRQYVLPKRWYLHTSPHGVTTQKNRETSSDTSGWGNRTAETPAGLVLKALPTTNNAEMAGIETAFQRYHQTSWCCVTHVSITFCTAREQKEGI
jgi:hypothetical protein